MVWLLPGPGSYGAEELGGCKDFSTLTQSVGGDTCQDVQAGVVVGRKMEPAWKASPQAGSGNSELPRDRQGKAMSGGAV